MSEGLQEGLGAGVRASGTGENGKCLCFEGAGLGRGWRKLILRLFPPISSPLGPAVAVVFAREKCWAREGFAGLPVTAQPGERRLLLRARLNEGGGSVWLCWGFV